LLITRGALTTFSIANDVAKYFAIIPAMFMVTYPALQALNIMRLHSAQSAILAAVVLGPPRGLEKGSGAFAPPHQLSI